MAKENKEITILTLKQILLYLADASVGALDVFDPKGYYRKPISDYQRWRRIDKIRFDQRIYRLKKQKIINVYLKDKEKYIELTEKGKGKVSKYLTSDLKIKIPSKWDKKWRLVIFDIPNKHKTVRDILRKKLEELGFLKLQESVYIFPYECFAEINFLRYIYNLAPYVIYIVCDYLETDVDLINYFFDQGIIKRQSVKKHNK